MYKGNFVIKLRSESEALAFLEEMEEKYSTTWRSGRKPTDPAWIEYYDDIDVKVFGVGVEYKNGSFILWYDDWNHMVGTDIVIDNYKIIPFYKSKIYKF